MGGHNWTVLFKFLENTGWIYRIWVLYFLLLLLLFFFVSLLILLWRTGSREEKPEQWSRGTSNLHLEAHLITGSVHLHIDQMLQCSESVYSAVSLTLHHWHTQQSSSTWPSSSSSSGLSQRLLKVCGAQVWYQFISSSILSKFWVDFLLVVFQRVEDRSASLRVPQRQQLDQEKQSKSAVKPAVMCMVVIV